MDLDLHKLLMEKLDTIEEKNVQHLKQVSERHNSFFIDVDINCSAFILPGHKYVLSARSAVLREQFQSGVNELDWTNYDPQVGLALLKWMYTDTIVLDNNTVALGLLRASYHFQLETLFEACESMLLKSVNEEHAHAIYSVAEEVGAQRLAEVCMPFRLVLCDDSATTLETTLATNRCHSAENDMHALLDAQRNSTCQMEQEIWKRLIFLVERHDKISKLMGGISEYVKCCDVVARGRGSIDWVLHSYVFIARSEKSREELLSNKSLHWYKLSKDSARALLRWLYTDLISLDSENLALDLIKAAHEYKLSSLFELCEQVLIRTVNITSCAKIHSLAKDVGATILSKHCTSIVSAYWDGLQSKELVKFFQNVMEGSSIEVMACERELSSLETPKGLLTLNDDCLFHLFRFLSLVDLGSLKDTCQRLKHLVDRSFIIYGQKSLTIDSSSMFADLWILQHFGKFINSLIVRDYYAHFASHDDIFAMIAKFCNVKLEKISLNLKYEENVSDESLKCVEKILKNVEVINLAAFWHCRQIDLLLSYCENLKEVFLEGDEMTLNTFWFKKNCNVKRITLIGLDSDDILEEIGKTMIHLEYLVLNFVVETDIHKISHLTRLNHLKHLEIGTYYDEIGNFLRDLSRKNLLEHLSVWYLDVDELVAYAVGHFTKLKDLRFYEMDSRIDENILDILSKQLNNIEKLSFVECEEITFGDITKIIKNHLKLKELEIYDCNKIDFVDMKNYLRLKKRRNLKIYLDKIVYDRSIELLADCLSHYVQLVPKPSE